MLRVLRSQGRLQAWADPTTTQPPAWAALQLQPGEGAASDNDAGTATAAADEVDSALQGMANMLFYGVRGVQVRRPALLAPCPFPPARFEAKGAPGRLPKRTVRHSSILFARLQVQEVGSPSFYNPIEASALADLVQSLLESTHTVRGSSGGADATGSAGRAGRARAPRARDAHAC